MVLQKLSQIFSAPSRSCRNTALAHAGAEVLEERQLLTDFVAVTIKGNSITLIGDNDWNWMLIGRNGDNVWLRGLDGTEFTKDALDPSKGNLIEPDSFVTNIPVGEVTGLKINLKGGSDRISIDPINVSGKTSIVTGKGEDWVILDGTAPSPLGGGTFSGPTSIKTGSDDDAVDVNGWTFDGPLKVATGSGSDLLFAGDTDIVDFNGKVSVNLGSGNDAVVIDESLVSGTSSSVLINGGSGLDAFFTLGGLTQSELLAQGIKTKGFEGYDIFEE